MLTLSLACTLSDRTRPILDGRIAVPGVTFDATTGEPEDIFRRALRDRDLEVTELSMGSHIVTEAMGVVVRLRLQHMFEGSGQSRVAKYSRMP